jgi:hypothetical protein
MHRFQVLVQLLILSFLIFHFIYRRNLTFNPSIVINQQEKVFFAYSLVNNRYKAIIYFSLSRKSMGAVKYSLYECSR